MKLSIYGLALMLGLAACAVPESSYLYRQQAGLGFLGEAEYQSRRSWVLSEKASIAVAPFQPTFLSRRQNQRLLMELVSKLSEDFVRVEVVAQRQSVYEQLAIARSSGAHYLVVPSVVALEQRLNAISELTDEPGIADIGRDAISFKMALYDVPNARLVDVSVVRASSAAITLEPTEPKQIAASAFDLYVGRLSAAPYN